MRPITQAIRILIAALCLFAAFGSLSLLAGRASFGPTSQSSLTQRTDGPQAQHNAKFTRTRVGPRQSNRAAAFPNFEWKAASLASPAALFVPNISVVKSATLATDVNNNGFINPGDTLMYSVVVSNAGTDALSVIFTDQLNSDLTLLGAAAATPIAQADSYTAIGNTQLQVGSSQTITPAVFVNGNVLANDIDPNGGTLTATAGTFATTLGGSITLTANGTFVYTPPLNTTGTTDTFTYTISSSNGGKTDTGMISFTLSNRVWYVRNNAAAGGDGRSNTPFDTLAEAQTASSTSDYIFVHRGDGTTTGQNAGITLKNNQLLIGEGVALVVNSLTLTTAGLAPIIGNSSGSGITLAQNNTVRGLTIGNTTAAAISGNTFGTLALDTVSINTSNQALSLTTGTANATFSSVTSSGGTNNVALTSVAGTISLGPGALSGATSNAFDVDQGTAGISFSGTINAGSALAVDITNKTSGTVALSGAVAGTGAGRGINLNSNTGATINFTGGVTLSTSSSAAFTATGGGTVTVTGSANTLTTTTGTALNVTNTNIGASGLTFRSISANGAPNGIVLNNTGSAAGNGGLTVSGNGGTCTSAANCTGGAIQSTSGDGIALTSTKSPSFDRIRIQNTGGDGISGSDVHGFTLTNSSIFSAGDGDEENGIIFGNDNAVVGTVTTLGVDGTVLIQDVTIDGNNDSTQWGVRVYNNSNSATLNMTMRRVTVQNNIDTGAWLFGEAGVNIQIFDGTANVLVDDCDFLNTEGMGIAANAGDSSAGEQAVLHMTVQDSTFTNNQALPSALSLTTTGDATAKFKVTGNTITGPTVSGDGSMGIDLDASLSSNLDAIVLNNTMDVTYGTGLEFIVNENALGKLEARNNTINLDPGNLNASSQQGMNFNARSVGTAGQTGQLHLTLANNTITGITSNTFGFQGFNFVSGSSTLLGSQTMCVNAATAGGAGNNSVSGTAGLEAWSFRQRTSTVFQIQGLSPTSGATEAQIEAFIAANNNAGNLAGNTIVAGASGTTIVSYTAATCQTPTTPTLPTLAGLIRHPGDWLQQQQHQELAQILAQPLSTEARWLRYATASEPTPYSAVTDQRKPLNDNPPLRWTARLQQRLHPVLTALATPAGYHQLEGAFAKAAETLAPTAMAAEFAVPSSSGSNATTNAQLAKDKTTNKPARTMIVNSRGEARVVPTAALGKLLAGELITINGTGSGFTLPAGESTTVMFNAQISSSFTGTALTNQASVSGSNFSTVNSNNLSTPVIQAPNFSKAFSPATIATNTGVSTLTFTLVNPNPAQSLSGVTFSDSLLNNVQVAGTPNAMTTNCGAATWNPAAAATSLSFSGGTIPAGGTCTVKVDVRATTEGSKPNTSSAATSTEANASGTASATLTVINAPSFTKAFGAPSIPLNGTTSLTFPLTNNSATSSLSGVGFTDMLPAGLVVATPNGLSTTCSGTASATAGGSSVNLLGATLATSSSCTLTVNVTGTTAGAKDNSATLTTTELGAASAATGTVTLTVFGPPTISKAFSPTSIFVGGTFSQLTFTITNPNASGTLTGVGFSDALPSGLEVNSSPGVVVSNCGGSTDTSSFTAGATTLNVSQAAVTAGTPCTIRVNVIGTTAGAKANTTGAITSTEGGTGTTSNTATLNVFTAPQIAKSFGASVIPVGGTTTVTFVITNPAANPGALTTITFIDSLPSGLVVGTPNGVSNTCSGSVTAVAGSGTISLGGASITTPGNTCQVQVNVTGNTAGVKNNSVTVSSDNGGTGNTAMASLTVANPPTVSKVFAPSLITPNGTSTLTITLTNPNATLDLTGALLTDTLPAGVTTVNSTAATTCSGGSALQTSNTVGLSGGTIPQNGSCTLTVDVTSAANNVYTNTISPGDLTTANSGPNTNTANATLTVADPPTISKSFAPNPILPNGTSTLTITLTNPNSNVPLTLASPLTDTLPLNVTTVPTTAATTCSGGTPSQMTGSVTLTGGTIPTSGSCTVSVDVTSATAGAHLNTISAGALVTNGGSNANPVTATLVVGSAPAITKSFSPNKIKTGATSTMTIAIANNNAAIPFNGVSYTDTLPSGLTVPDAAATTACGGTLTVAANVITLTGATIAAGETCTTTFTVTGATTGVKNNTVTVDTANFGTGFTGTGTVTVYDPPTITKSFLPTSVPFGGTSTMSFVLTNPNTFAGGELTGLSFTDMLPEGLQNSILTTSICGGTLITAPLTVTFSGGTLGTSGPGNTCTLNVTVTGAMLGSWDNTTGALSATETGAGGTSNTATLTVTASPTTTTITADTPDPSVVGQSYTVSVTVAPSMGGMGTPTGTVTVGDGTGATCNITLSGGTGSCNLTSTTAGTKTISANYGGNTNFATSATTTMHTVNQAGTTTAITNAAALATPTVVGQSYAVTWSVTVNSPGALGAALTGNVTVSDGLQTCVAAVSAGTCNLTSTTVGVPKNLTASYAGDGNYSGSTSTPATPHTVNKADTTATITDDTPDPSVIGQSYAVTASVTANPPGAGTPSGTITVTDGTNNCTITLPGTSCNLPSTSVGAKTLTATYNGDANYNASAPSAGVSHTVNKADVLVTITSDNPDSSAVGQNVTVAFTVAAVAPGAGTPTGTVTITASGGSETCTGSLVAGSGSCTLALTVPGDRTLTATYNGDANFNTDTDTATHTVVAPPVIAKAFSPAAVAVNGTSQLTFTITNPAANTVSLTGVTFTDLFPAGMVAGNPAVLQTTNCGSSVVTDQNNLSFGPGDTGITVSNVTAVTATPCIVKINVVPQSAGTFVNVTGNVSSANGGTGNTATDTLRAAAPPTISKSFSPAQIPLNGTATLTFNLANPAANTLSLTNVSFNDTFPAGVEVDATPTVTNTCGGSFTANAGATSVSLSGVTLAQNASCALSVKIKGTTAGVKNNVSGNVSAFESGAGGTASATLTVVAPPAFSKAFTPTSVPLGQASALGFTITNNNATVGLTGIAFTDILPVGLTVADGTFNNVCGAGSVLTVTAGTRTISLSNGNLAAATPNPTTCTFSVNVTGAAPGNQVNLTQAITSSEGGTGGTATATLVVVAPPLISKSFNPATVPLNGVSTLTITFANPPANTVPLTGVGVVDNFPAGLIVDVAPMATTSCGGGFSPAPVSGNTGVAITGATVPINGACSFTVKVKGTTSGLKTNTTNPVTSTNGGTGLTATATIQVNAPPTVNPIPLTIAQGTTTKLFSIATINDIEDGPLPLLFQISSDGVNFSNTATSNGVTVTYVSTAADGTVTANVSTTCTATTPTFTFKATDTGNQMTTAAWPVTVPANPAPVLSYGAPTVTAGTTPTINPATGPSDNGTITSIVLQSVAPNNGGLSVNVNNTTGVVSVVSATLIGNYTVTIVATDQCGAQTTATLAINVVCPTITFTPTALPNGTVNTAYAQTITASPAGGNYSYTVTSGALPNGLTLNTATGEVTGTPTQSGTFNFRVTAAGWGGCSAFRDYSLTILCPTITLAPTTLPNGTVGSNYNQAVTASPAGTYSYAVTSGALPAGVTLNNATGALTGTPTANGTFNFTITATAGGCSGSQSYSLIITCPVITLTPATLPGAQAGVAYNQTLGANPAGTYTFSLLTGNLPPGMTLNGSTGQLSGTATATGTYTFSVQAQAGSGCSGTQSYSLTVSCPTITINPASLPNGTVGTAYNQTLSGTPSGNYSFAKTSGTLPPGLTLSSAGGLTGTPTTQGSYTFTVTATVFGSCQSSRSYTVTIGASCATITLPALPTTGTVNVNYTGNLAATTPSASYTFTLDSGTLPPGLVIDNLFAQLRGKPTTAGSYTFTLKATRSNGCTGTRAYTVTIGGGSFALARRNDFDGDGKSDLVMRLAGRSDWLLTLSGTGETQTVNFGAAADVPVFGDYDGDGKTDLAVYRPADATWLLRLSSTRASVEQRLAHLPAEAQLLPVAADYDGDGRTDLALWESATASWFLQRSSDGKQLSFQYGSAGAVAIPADYDGDGQADWAVFERADARWRIHQSSDGADITRQFGGAKDEPLVADFDGDGRADLGVWRAVEGALYVQASRTAQAARVAIGLGSPADWLLLGDYDGDGQTEIAVWRAAEARWYVRLSNSAALYVQAQGQSKLTPATNEQR